MRQQFSEEIAKELNISPDIVDKVILDYWKGIKYYTLHPFEIKAGIISKDFIHVRLSIKRIKWIIWMETKVNEDTKKLFKKSFDLMNDLYSHYEYWKKNGKGSSRNPRKKIK